MAFREIAAVVIDNNFIDICTDNSSGHVSFDFWKIWEIWKKQNFDTLVMIHTHPKGMNELSSIDHNMLDGWVKAFPIPILFVIVAGDNIDRCVAYLSSKNITKFKVDFESNFLIKKIWELSTNNVEINKEIFYNNKCNFKVKVK